MEIVKRSDDMKGFVLFLRRWDGRAPLLLVRTKPASRQGLRESRRNPDPLRYPRLHPTRCQASRQAVAFESGFLSGRFVAGRRHRLDHWPRSAGAGSATGITSDRHRPGGLMRTAIQAARDVGPTNYNCYERRDEAVDQFYDERPEGRTHDDGDCEYKDVP